MVYLLYSGLLIFAKRSRYSSNGRIQESEPDDIRPMRQKCTDDQAPSVYRTKERSSRHLPHSQSSRHSRLAAGLLQDRLHHLISKLRGLGKAGSEVRCDPLKPITIGLKVPKGDAVGPCLIWEVSENLSPRTKECAVVE